MRRQVLGAAILGALAVAATAQSTPNPQLPSCPSAVPTRPSSAHLSSWPAQRRADYLLEASQVVQPTHVPAKGRGLPSEPFGGTWAPSGGTGAPLPGPGPFLFPSGTSSAPLIDDLAGPGRSQPLLHGFEGTGPGTQDWACPDIAVGFGQVVAVTADEVATYDKAGNELFREEIHSFLGISTTYDLHQPHIVFDPWDARWVMIYHKTKESTEESSVVLVVSASSTPFGLGSSWYYDINAVQTGASGKAHADSFGIAFSNDYLTLGGNMHYFSGPFLWSRIWILDKAAAYAGAGMPTVKISDLHNPDGTQAFAPCAVEMQVGWSESSNIDGVWINSRDAGGSKLTLWKCEDAFGANTLNATEIAVNAYAYPPNAQEPDGSYLHALDCRITSAVISQDTLGTNGTELFTGLNADRSGVLGCSFYKIDPTTATKEWEWSFGSAGIHYFNPRVAADFSGSAFWTFTKTAPVSGYYAEMRFVDYDQGVFSNSSTLVRAGEGNTGYYWGFYAGAQLDWADFAANGAVPGRPAKVWMYGQYAKPGSWGTYVGASSVFGHGYLFTVQPSTTWYISGTVGGYFVNTSRDYTLTNAGEVGFAWKVTSLPPWLTATPDTGHLTPGSTTTQLSIDMDVAKWLTPGTYTADVVFVDVFNGGFAFSRHVEVNVAGDGIAYCTGEVGEGTPCPCNNDNDGSLPDAGCANGAFASGAKLIATGDASVSADTIQLVAANVHPSNSGLFFQADNAVNSGAGLVFGDGLRCAGGALIRLQVRFANSSGVAQTSVSISSKGGISAGETKRYQYWYRDNSGHQPCGVGVNDFNLTNGLRITWGA